MKFAKTIVKALLVIFILGSGADALCQIAEPVKNKLKSVVVYTEKNNALVAKKFKESEVYYDQQGNVIEEMYYKDGRVTTHFKYTYDAAGNKTREEEYDSSGKLSQVSEYKIENGLRTEKVVYDSQHNVKSKKFYQYTSY
ncbi:MAG TPA: RHS repeat domain-containing protein [Bacteroidales bacterium]|nr:RHS repeat domain-containing protein [Bacteroidales bacterium]